MAAAPPLKPVRWVGSSRRDVQALPEPVQDHLGYALYIAQCGGKHRDTKTLSGFGGAGVVEIITDYGATPFELSIRCNTKTQFTCCMRSKRSPTVGGQLPSTTLT
jgi:hypothetical protein